MDKSTDIPREATASVTRLLEVAREAGDYRRAAKLAREMKPSRPQRPFDVHLDRFSLALGILSTLSFVAVVVWTYTFHHV